MTLDLGDCTASGPALPEPFLRLELAGLLQQRGLLPPQVDAKWPALRSALATLGSAAGPLGVHNHLVVPLARCLGYDAPRRQDVVQTREGPEDGGWLLNGPGGARLRSWTVARGADLDAASRSGRAYRFSPSRTAFRVLLASGERAGLLSNGDELRFLVADPARPDSHLTIRIGAWRAPGPPPDSLRLVLALASPPGIAALADILQAARLNQARITRDLRVQARAAIEAFVQSVLDHPANADELPRRQRSCLAAALWREALIVIYRLLFILKLESVNDPARAFSFAATRLWRDALSPNQALGPLARRLLDHAHDTGGMLETGLRNLFRSFRDGLSCSELSIAPVGGALFGPATTPTLDRLAWGEGGVALLLDRLLWTTPRGRPRERVHYGSLDVEELGRVYEALLELEPGIATRPMVRLRHSRMEAVVPANGRMPDAPARIERLEDIPPGRFFLRAGLGRKATGAYYTPHVFVRFLVRETLAPRVSQRSPDTDPDPAAILALRVVDPATGSGHFLVEACRFLGEALYAACRQCDALAADAEAAASRTGADARTRLEQRAAILRARLAALPDPDGTLLAYLPSRTCDGGTRGVSESKALAVCRRLVAVHCLYGVDRNPLAIELAKLSLWLESFAEGLPLTFLDHRLVAGDSLSGPFFAQLATLPVGRTPITGVVSFGIMERLQAAAAHARSEVRLLECSVGRDASDLLVKQAAKHRLDAVLGPLRALARAWSGAASLASADADAVWLALARHVADTGAWPATLSRAQQAIMQAGEGALPWDLMFPEVFAAESTAGFDAVLGNPPWDVVQYSTRDFVAAFDLNVLDAPTKRERAAIERRVMAQPAAAAAFDAYKSGFEGQKRVASRLYCHQKASIGRELTAGNLDVFRLFAERTLQLAGGNGAIGIVVPSAFHANEGATALRLLYLRQTSIACCLSFENRRKLFDIDSRFRFALLVARRPGPTRTMRCAFYLESLEQIDEPDRLLTYDPGFIRRIGGARLAFPELHCQADAELCRQLSHGHALLGAWCEPRGITFGRDLHMTDDAAHFVPLSKLLPAGRTAHDTDVSEKVREAGYLLLHEGKTFHQFTDRWDTPPRYAVPEQALEARPATRLATRQFRLVFRDIARSSDERTLIAAIAPPHVVFGHTANTERVRAGRPAESMLLLAALLNSFPLDWMVRRRAGAHLSLFIINDLPLPPLSAVAERFLAHGALRLTCNHAGFAPLWREQLGNEWREAQPVRQAWPVLAEAEQRWRLRAAMDAVIAHGFGLDRAAYRYVLSGFSHRSCPDAPGLCLAAFDALLSCGEAAFCRDQDPYAGLALAA